MYNNYRYKIDKKYPKSTGWRCVHYEWNKCKARMSSDEVLATISENTHNHDKEKDIDWTQFLYSRNLNIKIRKSQTFYFIKGAKNPILVHKDHKYTVVTRRPDSTTWRCVGYEYHKCPARIKTHTNVAVLVNHIHNHPSVRTDLSKCHYKKILWTKQAFGSRITIGEICRL
ncbi:FLYWCH zinc finger domain [Popillia japonica]|uniref:FLYWCH zinc finger domain n=1 Tax=Popillia japonica TaxID=7064 RepID=A0AAW1MM89_POPJA